MNPQERLNRINALLDEFTSHSITSDGRRSITVEDHYYLDTEFFPELFQILGRFDGLEPEQF